MSALGERGGGGGEWTANILKQDLNTQKVCVVGRGVGVGGVDCQHSKTRSEHSKGLCVCARVFNF